MLVAALLLPASVALAQAAGGVGSAGGTAAIACDFFRDDMRITPGLRTSPAADQTATATGRVYGCNKSGGSAKFSASVTMTAATCGSFSMQGTGKFEWANGQVSTATLVFQQQDFAPQKYLLGGAITSGPYKNLLVYAYLRFTLENKNPGQTLCTASNPAVKASFTNASSLQLVTPDTPPTFPAPTTVPPTPTTQPTTTTSSTLAPVQPTNPPITTPPGPLPNTGVGSWGALIGAEAVLIGGGLGLLGQDRRRRRSRTPGRAGARSWLEITMPPE